MNENIEESLIYWNINDLNFLNSMIFSSDINEFNNFWEFFNINDDIKILWEKNINNFMLSPAYFSNELKILQLIKKYQLKRQIKIQKGILYFIYIGTNLKNFSSRGIITEKKNQMKMKIKFDLYFFEDHIRNNYYKKKYKKEILNIIEEFKFFLQKNNKKITKK